MTGNKTIGPENTAERVALWRALHAQIDEAPHVLDDEVGIKLLAPDESWRQRQDMDPHFTRMFRAAIVARARFIDDLVVEQSARGVGQYVILGAGLDSFAQRLPDVAAKMQVFEIDQAGPQQWKRERLIELGYGCPDWLHFVPVDFEAGDSWLERLTAAGFDPAKVAVVASTGVSLYLSREATAASLRQIATLSPGSTLAMTYIQPVELCDPEELPGRQASERGARANGTPFVSFYSPEDMTAMALECGFKDAYCVSGIELTERYFLGRADELRPGNSEGILVANT